MKRFDYYTYILAIILFVATSACTEKLDLDSIDLTAPGSFVARSPMESSQADPEIHTYRILTYSEDYSFDNPNTGTYQGRIGEIMEPKVLDDYGIVEDSYGIDHISAILDGVSGSRWVLCASPGIKNNDDGSFDFLPAAPDNTFLVSKAVKLNLGRPMLYQLGTLVDRRSRLRFKVAIDPQLTGTIKSIGVSEFTIKGVGGEDENIRMFPAQRQILQPHQTRYIELSDFSDANEGTAFVTTNPVYIASAFYAPRNVVASQLKVSTSNSNIRESDYIQVSFKLSQNGGKPTKMTFVINEKIPELEPMHEYTFVFNVKSRFIDLTLDIVSYDGLSPHNWYVHDNLWSAPIGEGISSVTIGSWNINNWNDHALDDNTEIKDSDK